MNSPAARTICDRVGARYAKVFALFLVVGLAIEPSSASPLAYTFAALAAGGWIGALFMRSEFR